MKIMNKFLLWILPKNVIAITLMPFGMYFRDYDVSLATLMHEGIHKDQQEEMLYIFFYLWYFVEWLIKLVIYGKYAYWNLSFEREARELKTNRKHFAWIKYL